MIVKVLFLLSFLVFSGSISSQEVNFQIDEKSWQKDVQFLKSKVEKIVPTYRVPEVKKAFDAVYEILETSDLGNKKEDIVFAFQMLLNTINDEGCNVPLFQKGVDLKVLPLKTYWFNDGLFVLDAAENYKQLVGEQIVKINDTNVEAVFERLKTFLNADNDFYKKHLFQVYGLMPSVLKIVDLGKSNDAVLLEFTSGKTMTVTSDSVQEYSKLDRGLPNDEFFSYKNSSHKGENYWFDFIPNTKTLFVQLQVVANNDNGDSFSDFVKSIEKILENNKADKVIIDVRYGGGGNGFKLKSLTDLLRDTKAINKDGRLFVLTSKATRGTLLELASILDLNTKAVIVGEPTSEGVNTVGDTKYITLPNSGLKISLTHTFWPTSWKVDKSTFLSPEKDVIFNYRDQIQNTDPWLQTIDAYDVIETSRAIPKDLMNKLIGTYKIEGRKVTIENNEGSLFLTMSRKMKSFFEINTQLYFQSNGIISTDIKDVFLTYSIDDPSQIRLESLKWKGHILNIL